MATNASECGGPLASPLTPGYATQDANCPVLMQTYCSIDDPIGPGSKTYTEKWEGDEATSFCKGFVQANVDFYGNNIESVNRTQGTVDAYVRRYLITENNAITQPSQGSLIYMPEIQDVVEVCQGTPGGCDSVLTQKCQGFSRDDMAENINVGKLCGCFMNDQEYTNYAGAFNVQPICDPACARSDTVKPRVPGTGLTERCDQTICVIDDVSIDILNNSNTGDINFAQACGQCDGNAGCLCYISDISITATESTIGDLNFDQQCGGNPRCFKSNAAGVPQPVDCSILEGDGSSSTASNISLTTILIIIGIVVAVIIIIIIIAVIVGRSRNKNLYTRYRPPAPTYAIPPMTYASSSGPMLAPLVY